MDCKEFNSMVLPHLDGLLESDQSALLDDHAAYCAACSRELALQSRLSHAMRGISREEITAPPELGSLVIKSLKSEHRGRVSWMPPAWRRTAAAAAAILLLAGSSAGVAWQMAQKNGPTQMADNGTTPAVIDTTIDTPSDSAGNDITIEGLPGKNPDIITGTPQDNTGSPAGSGKSEPVGTLSSGPTAFLSSGTVITSTVLRVNVEDLSEARIKAVAFAAGVWANTQVFPEQNGDQKIVVLRLTVASDQAPGLIAKLTSLGTLTDRQDESRDITALYNETQVLCSDLEARRSTASDSAELQGIDQQISSYRQQLDAWEAEAGKRVIMLWLENN